MPREYRSNLPGMKDKTFLLPTKEEKQAKRDAEHAARMKALKEERDNTVPPPKLDEPKYDPERLSMQSYGPTGLTIIQQTHRFSPMGKYLGEVAPGQAYVTTEEMERNNQRDRARWRAKSRNIGQITKALEPVPAQLIEAGRENAAALAAERLAE